MSIAELQKTSNFYAHRDKIEQEVAKSILGLGEKTKLRDACEYALKSGGKRFRPLLVLLVADALGNNLNVIDAALSVEFFHTASLIADDLPCMDNDDLRRNRPSLHKAFGESTAILASYALIAEGYGGIYRNGKNHPEGALLCLEAATRCAGMCGAVNGQYLDLYPPNDALETIQKVIYQKTVTLFEISFIFGWIFGGGDLQRLDAVKQGAFHLGMAFQIADDLIDGSQDSRINMVRGVGRDLAMGMFDEEMNAFISSMKGLGLWNEDFQEMVLLLQGYASASAGFLAPPAIFS